MLAHYLDVKLDRRNSASEIPKLNLNLVKTEHLQAVVETISGRGGTIENLKRRPSHKCQLSEVIRDDLLKELANMASQRSSRREKIVSFIEEDLSMNAKTMSVTPVQVAEIRS